MSIDTERYLRFVSKAMEDKDFANEDELNEYLGHLTEQFNREPFPHINDTSDLAFEEFALAQEALEEDAPDSERRAIKHLKQALKYDPQNYDAKMLLAELQSDPMDFYQKLKDLETDAEAVCLERAAYTREEALGIGWGIIEMRPCLRIKHRLAQEYLDLGMYRLAQAKCEELLEWTENDNQGVRYILMGIYAFFEDESAATELFERYDKDKNAWMLLSMAALSYKLDDQKACKKYLDTLVRTIPEGPRAIIAMLEDEDAFESEYPGHFRVSSGEEVVVAFEDLSFLLTTSYGFMTFLMESMVKAYEKEMKSLPASAKTKRPRKKGKN